MRSYWVPLLFVGFLSACQTPQIPAQCASPEFVWKDAVADVLKRVPDSKYVELDADARGKFLEVYNATGNPTGYLWERIGYAYKEAHPVALVFFGMGNCLWVTQGIPLSVVRMLMGEPAGQQNIRWRGRSFGV